MKAWFSLVLISAFISIESPSFNYQGQTRVSKTFRGTESSTVMSVTIAIQHGGGYTAVTDTNGSEGIMGTKVIFFCTMLMFCSFFLSRRRCFYLLLLVSDFLRATVQRCYRSTVKILRHICNKNKSKLASVVITAI